MAAFLVELMQIRCNLITYKGGCEKILLNHIEGNRKESLDFYQRMKTRIF